MARANTRAMMHALHALPAFRPGIAYFLDTLYLAPTHRSSAVNSMRSCRGPSFQMRADSGFEEIVDPEPSAKELASIVDGVYSLSDNLGSMGEGDLGVVFQGQGDPLEAHEVVLETVALVAANKNSIAFRCNTLGLCGADVVDALLSSPVLARGDEDQRRETRLAKFSVFLPAANPAKYAELIQPQDGRGFQDVCAFITRMAEAGVEVECTAVERPDVNINEIRALAMALGARSFRVRSFHA